MDLDPSEIYPGHSFTFGPDPSRYLGSDDISLMALKTLFHDVSEKRKMIPPKPLDDALDYSYQTTMYFPIVSCKALSADAARAFRPEIENVIVSSGNPGHQQTCNIVVHGDNIVIEQFLLGYDIYSMWKSRSVTYTPRLYCHRLAFSWIAAAILRLIMMSCLIRSRSL